MVRGVSFWRTVSALLLIACVLLPEYSSAGQRVHPVNVHLDDRFTLDSPAPRYYLTADPAEEAGVIELRRQLIERGARKVNLFLPALLVFELPAGLDLGDLLSISGLQVVEEGNVAQHTGSGGGLSPAQVKCMYEKVQQQPAVAPTASYPPDFLRNSFQDKVIIISNEEVERVQKAVFGESPQLEQRTLYQNSEYMVGDILVQLVFPESDGGFEASSENWEDAELSEAISNAFIGMLNFQERFSNIPMNMVFRTLTRIRSRYEPVKHNMEDGDYLWINDTMETLGYNNGNPLASVHHFNNDGRAHFGTDWVFTAFIANSENAPQHRFNDAWYTAYANLGGPYLVIPFPAGENPFNIDEGLLFSEILQHETCHIFWALDEYPEASGTCGDHSGYLDIYNRNKLWLDPDGVLDSCQEIVPCIMARAKEDLGRPICDYTAGQMGAVLTPGTGVPRVLDSTPTVQFEKAGIETVETDNLSVRLKAFSTPVPNKNYFQQPPEVRLNYAAPLKSGLLSVDDGDQMVIQPEDGRWDDVEEDMVIHLVSLPTGLIQLGVSVRNSVGRSSPVVTKKIFNIGLHYSHFFVDEHKDGIRISWQMAGETFGADFDLHRIDVDRHGEDIVLVENIQPADTLNDQFLYFSYFDTAVTPGSAYKYYVEGTITLKRGGQDVVYHSSSSLTNVTAMVPITGGSFLSYPTPNPFNPTGRRLSLSIDVPKSTASIAGQASPMAAAGSRRGLASSGSGWDEQPTTVEVAVFDVTGRRIKDLFSQRVYSGILTVSWDGTSETNRLVPSGVYFLRVKAGGTSEARKVLVLR